MGMTGLSAIDCLGFSMRASTLLFLFYCLVSKIRGLAQGQGAFPTRDTARFQCI